MRSIRLVWIIAVVAVLLPADALAATLQPANVTQFFLAPDEATPLTWKVEAAEPGAVVRGLLRGYRDDAVEELQLKVGDDRTVRWAPRRTQGYYEIEFPESQQRFGLVVLPPQLDAPDPFFSIDAAMSWLVRDESLRESLIQNLRRSGIAMARERLNWTAIQPTRERWEWDGPQRYAKLRQTYAANKVELLEMFHDAPGWLGHVERYPDDLVGTARAWQVISQHWHAQWAALEVWNEPDIFFGGNLPADQYVPLVKVLAWVQRQTPPGTPLVGGVLAQDNPKFMDCAAANGLLECVQVASFHTYGRALGMEELVGRYRRWLQAGARETLPLWLTECGRPWKRGTDRASAREDAESALDITMKAVEAKACGLARYFAFVYPFYEENESNFGMMDRHGTPLRSLAAYARAAAVLRHKRYAGDLRCADPSLKRARVFTDGRETVAVLYTAASTGAGSVQLGVPVQRLEGIDGRALQSATDGSVPLGDGLAYAWLDGSSLGERLQTKTTAAQLWALAQQPAAAPQPPAPLVLRYQFDRAAMSMDSSGYRLRSPTAGAVPLVVRVFNLDQQAHEAALKMAGSPAAIRWLGPETVSVKVPPGGYADATWQGDLNAAFAPTGTLRCTVTATADTPERTLPLVIDLTGDATLEQILQRYPRRVRVALDDPSAWRPNIVGHGRMTMKRTEEVPWQLEVSFGRGDRWVYPVLQLPADLDLSRFSGLVVRGRCERPAKVRVLLHEGESGVAYLTPDSIFPADGHWHAAAIAFRSLTLSTANAPDPNQRLDLDRVHRISIGMNSEADSNRLEISDLEVVGE